MRYTINLRPRYKETDQMGVVYYSNYLVWFEVARTELFRHIGYTYRDIEEKQGLRLMVVKAACSYKQPALYDDIIDIECIVSRLGNASIEFRYRVLRGKTLIAEGETTHVFTDFSNRAKRMPKLIREALK